MDLREFLSYFDFDYDIVSADDKIEQKLRQRLIEDGDLEPKHKNQDLICLIDLQGAYFGNIGSMRYPVSLDSIEKIIDRMDIYINDSVIDEFVSALEDRDIDTSSMSLSDMISKSKELGVGDGEVSYVLADVIDNPEKIYIEELTKLQSKKWFLEIVQDFDGSYYANLAINGQAVRGLPEHVDYNTLKDAIRAKTGICILQRKDMKFQQSGRKKYAYIDNTQEREDCRVLLTEMKAGWKPKFEEEEKKPSLADKIQSAAERSSALPSSADTKTPERI